MAQFIEMPTGQIDKRKLKHVSAALVAGGVAVVPTDSCYALCCQVGNLDAIERIRMIRQLDKNHHFTLMTANLSDLASYAEVSNAAYRFIKAYIPGPYTFILTATKLVPKKLKHPKRKTIGMRVPNHPVTLALLGEMQAGLLSVSLSNLPDDNDISLLLDQVKQKVDYIIESDNCSLLKQTTVVDYTGLTPELVRLGVGAVDWE